MEEYLELLKIYKKIKKYSTKIIEFKMKIWKNNKNNIQSLTQKCNWQ